MLHARSGTADRCDVELLWLHHVMAWQIRQVCCWVALLYCIPLAKPGDRVEVLDCAELALLGERCRQPRLNVCYRCDVELLWLHHVMAWQIRQVCCWVALLYCIPLAKPGDRVEVLDCAELALLGERCRQPRLNVCYQRTQWLRIMSVILYGRIIDDARSRCSGKPSVSDDA
jgi:hypothetical protein